MVLRRYNNLVRLDSLDENEEYNPELKMIQDNETNSDTYSRRIKMYMMLAMLLMVSVVYGVVSRDSIHVLHVEIIENGYRVYVPENGASSTPFTMEQSDAESWQPILQHLETIVTAEEEKKVGFSSPIQCSLRYHKSRYSKERIPLDVLLRDDKRQNSIFVDCDVVQYKIRRIAYNQHLRRLEDASSGSISALFKWLFNL